MVDDDVRLLAVTEAMLRAHGYRVWKAGSAEEALDVLEQRQAEVDLLLSDVQMPGMNGLELASRLREIRPELPVILMTGSADLVSSDAKVLEKPFRIDDLWGIVAATLAGSERQLTGRMVLDRMGR